MIRAIRREIAAGVRSVVAAALAATALWVGCGGGSPSDLVLPEDVDVTLDPLEAPGTHEVGLALGTKNGREVTLQLVGTGLEDVTGVAFELHYDPNLLEFQSAEAGGFFGPGAVGAARWVEGSDRLLVGATAAGDQTSGRNGGGILLTLRFQLKQLRDTQSDLIFSVPQSLVYGPAGVAGQHTFGNARFVTRIRGPV